MGVRISTLKVNFGGHKHSCHISDRISPPWVAHVMSSNTLHDVNVFCFFLCLALSILLTMSSASHPGLLIGQRREQNQWEVVDVACVEIPLPFPTPHFFFLFVTLATESYLGFPILFRVPLSPREHDALERWF